MHNFKSLALAALMLLTWQRTIAIGQVSNPHETQNVTLRIKFRYQGDAPSVKLVETKDSFCQQFDISYQPLVLGISGELANVILIWDENRNRQYLPRVFEKTQDPSVEFKFEGCQLHPRIVVARVGQEVLIRNQDKNGHTGSIHFFNHVPRGIIQDANAPISRELTVSEPTPIRVGCEIHPWECAYLVVKDHPYVGFSNGQGAIEIKDLPVGKHWFQIWHESAKLPLAKAVWNGQEILLNKGRLLMELGPGINDLGIIELQAEQFNLEGSATQKKLRCLGSPYTFKSAGNN